MMVWIDGDGGGGDGDGGGDDFGDCDDIEDPLLTQIDVFTLSSNVLQI